MAGALDRFKEVSLWDFIRFEVPETWEVFYVAAERPHYGCYEEDGDTGTVWVNVEGFEVPGLTRDDALDMLRGMLSDSVKSPTARGGDTAEMLPPRSDTLAVQIYHFKSVDKDEGVELVHLHTTHAGWVAGKVYLAFFALVMTSQQAAEELQGLCRTMSMNLAAAEIDWEKATVPCQPRPRAPDPTLFQKVLFWNFITVDLPVAWEPFEQEDGQWACFPPGSDRPEALFVDFNEIEVRNGGEPAPAEAVRTYLEHVAAHGRTAEGGGYETDEIIDIAPGEAALRQTWRDTDENSGEAMHGTVWMIARWDPPQAIHVYFTLHLPASAPPEVSRRFDEALRNPRIDWKEARKQLDAGDIAPPTLSAN